MSDPYQPPSADLGQTSNAKLYSVHGIVIGTFFGSFAAGIVMLYLNYQALGHNNLARRLATWGTAIYLLIVLLSSFVPNSPVFGLLFIVVQALIAYFLADRLQGATIRYHRDRSGAMHSNTRAAGVGLLTGVAIIFALLAVGVLWAILTGTTGAPIEPVPVG